MLVGVAAALWIRKVQRPKRFDGSHLGEADLILALIAGIVTTLLLWHATQIALGENPWPETWSPVSNALSNLFSDGSATEALERVFVWAHVLLILSFLVFLPYSKHLHIATAGPNVFFTRTRARGRLEPLRFDVPDDEPPLRRGNGLRPHLEGDPRHDVLHRVRPLPGRLPRVRDREGAVAEAPDHESPRPASSPRGRSCSRTPPSSRARWSRTPSRDDVVWDCVTCGACVHECPVAIEHVDHIVDLRRHLVMVESRFPAEAEPMLRDVERSSNPWGKPQGERAAWAEGLGVRVLAPGDPAPEILYWVGCAASFDERARTCRDLDGEALARRGARRRDPRPARVLHRRPCAAHGQRVRVPGVRRAERRDAERGGRDEDRRELPALLQHARERVPGLRRPLRGRPPHRAPRRARARRKARARGRR